MKKFAALVLSLALALSLAACGGGEEVKIYKTGLGIVAESDSTGRTREKDGKAEIDTTVLVATFDSEGKVVSATVDVAQQSLKFTTRGAVVDPESVDLRTKDEKKDDYGMRGYSGIGKEIYEQQTALTDWMVGKTVEEILTGAAADPRPEDLAAGVTVGIDSYLLALQKAWENAVDTTGEVAKTGLGIDVAVSAKDAARDKDGQMEVDTTVVGAAFDADGKVVAALVDVAQNTVAFDTAGNIIGEFDARTKNEKKDDYGMRGYSGIGKEIYEQQAALARWMNGKTADEILTGAAADPRPEDLAAGVTVGVDEYLAAFKEASEKAK